jgi:hypothetical protein
MMSPMMSSTLHPGARTRPRASFVLAALFLASLASSLTGCGGSTLATNPADGFEGVTPFSSQDDPLATDVLRNGGRIRGPYRYPLAVGNHWDYVLRARVVTIPDVGEPTTMYHRSPWSVEVVGTEFRGVHEYFLVGEGDPRSAAPTLPRYFQRQDDEGFYELDVPPAASGLRAGAGGQPPASAVDVAALDASLAGRPHGAAFARAARQVVAKLERMRWSLATQPAATAGAEPNELTFLRYPLEIGAQWTVRESPFFGRIVTGQEELLLPVGRVRAWRIRLVSELYGPNDRAVFWYGRPGLVRTRVHAESEATDETGNVIGRVVADFEQALVRVRLNPAGGPS